MRWGTFFRVLFIVYCVEAGIFLVLAPWSRGWDMAVLHLPIASVYAFGLHPALRGGVTGFGLMHLVWGVHDLEGLLTRRRPRAAAS